MERIKNNVSFGLLKHSALNDPIHGIFGLPVELSEIVNRSIQLHVSHEHPVCRFCFGHCATIQTLVIKAKDLPNFFFEINSVFHERNADKKGIYK